MIPQGQTQQEVPQELSSQEGKTLVKQIATKLLIAQLTTILAQLETTNIQATDAHTAEVTKQSIRDLENVIKTLKEKLPNAIWI